MEVAAQRRLAAKIMKCGESRVWMDPAKLGEIAHAITAADVRRLIGGGVIAAVQKRGVSSGRKAYIAEQKRRGRRKGRGSRKGGLGSRFSRKHTWICAVRAQRKLLKEMLAAQKIDKKAYKALYRKSKGGYFRSRAHIVSYLESTAGRVEAEAKEKAKAKRPKGGAK